MSLLKKTAKCPSCLPDSAGACFTAVWSDEDSGLNTWECNNCGHRMPRRRNKPTEKITPSQQRVIDKLTEMGWKLEVTFIGRKVWISGKAETNWLFGDTMFGTIGPRGNFEFERQTPFIPAKKITDSIGLSVYFEVRLLKV